MVLPDSHRVARAPWYSGTAPKTRPFRLQGCHLLWPDFPDSSARVGFCNFVGLCRVPRTVLQHRTYNAGRLAYARFGLFPVRSPLLGESRLIYFPGGTEMVHFPPFASASYEFRERMTRHYP